MKPFTSGNQRDKAISRRFIILGGIVLILAVLILLTSRNDDNRIFNVETVYDTVFVADDTIAGTPSCPENVSGSYRVVAHSRTSIPKNPWRGHYNGRQDAESHKCRVKPNAENCRVFSEMVSALFSPYYYTPLSMESPSSSTDCVSGNVDLLYETCRQDSTYTFGVVCRWFSECPEDGVEWCSADSLTCYGASSPYPVFLVLGIGGSPDAPQDMYVLRAWTLRSFLTPNFLSKAHRKTPGKKFFYKPEGPWLN